MKRILLILFIVLSLSLPVQAFSDDFDSYTGSFSAGATFGGWYVDAGVWNVGTSPISNLTTGKYIYSTPTAGSPVISYSTSAVSSYFAVDMMYTANNYGTEHPYGHSEFIYESNGTANNYIRIGRSALDGGYTVWGSGLVPFAVTAGEWYRFILSISGSSLNIKTYDNNLVLVNEQTVGYTRVLNANVVKLSTTHFNGVGSTSVGFDNVVLSAVAPSASTSISWGSTEYVRDDTAIFSWALTDTDWNSYDRYFIRFYKDDILQDFGSFNIGCLCWSQFSIGSQTGSYSILADTAGAYKVTLEKGILSYTLIDDDTTRVRDYSSAYLLINKSVPYKTPVSAQYGFGFGGINLDYAIQTYYFDKDKNEYQFEHSFFGLSSSGTRTVYFEKTGTYILKLRNVRTDKTYIQTTTEATFAIPETVLNITTSTLKIDATSYNYGATIFGNYTIDNTNYTAGVTYLDILNTNNNILTEFYGNGISWTGVNEQTGDLLVNLLNSPASENFPAVKIFAGNNQLRLMLKNATGTTTVLAFVNFTILDTNTAGYGLKLSKYEVLTDETFYAYVTVPEANAKLVVLDPKGGCQANTNCTVLYNINLKNASKQAIPLVIKTEGTYSVLLNNPAGDTEIMQNVKVSKSLAPTPTGTVPPSWGTSDQIGSEAYTVARLDSYVGTMGYGVNNSTRFMFSVIIIVLFIILAALATKGNSQVAVTCGFLPFAFFTLISFNEGARAAGIEFLPKWPAIVFILLLALSVKIFR